MTEQVATTTTPPSMDEQFSVVFNNLNDMAKACKSLQEDLRGLYKVYRVAEKKSRIKPKKVQPKLNVSTSLNKFLGLNGENQLTKAEVMKMISTYIKENNLQLESNKRKFVPNKALLKLFNMSSPSEMTFVEINKNVSHHLSKLA